MSESSGYFEYWPVTKTLLTRANEFFTKTKELMHTLFSNISMHEQLIHIREVVGVVP